VNGRTASAAWKVLYAELEDFLVAAGGLPETQPLPWGGGSVTRIVPLIFPDQQRQILYADSIEYDTTAFVGAVGESTYKWAKVRVNFRNFSYTADYSLPFITEQFDGATEYITVPGSAFKFPSDDRILNTEIGVQVPACDFCVTIHRMPDLSGLPVYLSLQGRVNSTVFVPGYYNLAVGTVLYLGPSGTAETDIGGVKSYQLTHRFRFRSIPHNQLMRPDGTGFEAPVRIGDTSKGILLTGDLNQVFQY
jgi:hypothetical protein